MKRTGLFPTLLPALLAAPGSPALAQEAPFPEGRGSVYLGIFITDRDTETRFDSDSGRGTNINMEDDLGLESSMSVARLGGHVWFRPRHRFDFSVFDLSRSAGRPISETISFGDETFEVDTFVRSNFDFTIAKADYTFAALDRPRGYLGVTGGLYVANFELGISEPTRGAFESEDLTAPLPVFGLRGSYRITERIELSGAAQWFRLEIDDAGGRLRDFYVGADYRIGRRMDVGLAYNDVTMVIDADEPGGLNGQLSWGYNGWLVYVQVNFGRGD